jgi:hypothetical protein
MSDDPPFVGWDDADAATEIGTSCSLPGSIIQVAPLKNGKNNPTIFLQICKDGVEGGLSPFAKRKVCESRKDGRVEEWKVGRLERTADD